jgi:Raf kinase inhibitor-like YbhB/YbcL family protein
MNCPLIFDQGEANMKLSSHSFADQAWIPEQFAFGKIDANARVTLSENINPHLYWEEVPANTKSIAVICHDPDVPSKADDVNQEDREIPDDLPRIDFYHWVLVDLPVDKTEILEGEYSTEVTPRGKGGPLAPNDARQGVNNYTDWFAGDHDMEGDYFGYDGPCPPWNDSILHRYVFTVYALDVEKLPLDGRFTGAQAIEAMQPHILDQVSLAGIYTLNPRLAPKQVG